MSSDFGAGLDAALNAALAAVRGAAEKAKDRIDDGIAGVPSAAPAPDTPPMAFAAAPPSQHGAAVSFDIVESPLEFEGATPSDDVPLDCGVDSEGIPFPEENSSI